MADFIKTIAFSVKYTLVRKIAILSLFLSVALFTKYSARVVEANNKFGIHLAVASEEDLVDAARLVNSSGGDWGYVTVVIQENDLDRNKWQNVFDKMRELHLVPLVRIATSPQPGGFWRRPDVEDTERWANFLDSLNWVVKSRYVILFNEVNHGAEWGGQVDVESYGKVAFEFAKKLKERNSDFFIMLAGLDAAAPHQLPNYEDEEKFLRSLLTFNFELLTFIDGLSSHSYPNHGFIASPYKNGRNSIKTYEWELGLLRKFGVAKELPVFITETGWKHTIAQNSKVKAQNYLGLTEDQVAKNFEIAYKEVWLPDNRVVAVTPFVLNYQDDPFLSFSWRRQGEKKFYSQYEAVEGLVKLIGKPEQEQKFKIETVLPAKLTRNSTYQFLVVVKNEGQAIWTKEDGYQLKIISEGLDNFEYFFSDFENLPSQRTGNLHLHFKAKDKLGLFKLAIVVAKDGIPVSNSVDWEVETAPEIDIVFEVGRFLWRKSIGDNFKFLVYDEKEQVVYSKEKIRVDNDIGKVEKIDNIAFGNKYRLVLIRPCFLPRQTFMIFEDGKENKARFKFMWPVDFDEDGRLSFHDLAVWFEKLKMAK